MPFTVLYVCTGNVSRSPMAEALLAAWADPSAALSVSSCGTHALVGRPMDRGAASALGQLGIDPTRHRARQFEPAMAAAADLVLTAERRHRELVIAELPSAFRRVFTIKEFARITPYLEPGEPHAVVAAAAAHRGLVPLPDDPTDDDVADPYQLATKHSKNAAAELTAAARATLHVLSLDVPTPAAPAPAARPVANRPGPATARPSARPAPRPRPGSGARRPQPFRPQAG